MIFYRGPGACYTARSVTVEGQQVPKSAWTQGCGSSALWRRDGAGTGESKGLWIRCPVCQGCHFASNERTWGVLQVAHGCVEKTADEHGLLRGVEQSTMKADGGAIIGLMHGQSTNGSSRDMMQQGARVGAQR